MSNYLTLVQFEYCGDDYMKKLIIEDEHAYLRSFNDKYDDIYIDENSDFRILGRVVGRYAEQIKRR